ncbi:hypothetical protein AVEN_230529-1 [Araneus ventricosus]|uniref:Uncharacterized protein n=1 Tax=Araneus ventricosus TaxID=182803 RepID=A0A4Y2N5G0_ARAVE|nr:hypothetical protein AVEN_230529-1 [Araneus ventricosus]
MNNMTSVKGAITFLCTENNALEIEWSLASKMVTAVFPSFKGNNGASSKPWIDCLEHDGTMFWYRVKTVWLVNTLSACRVKLRFNQTGSSIVGLRSAHIYVCQPAD